MARRTKEQSCNIELSQESILIHAVELFREKGFRATSLEDVAARLGVTRPALYYYFKNKKEILMAAQRKAVEKVFNIEDILDDEALTVEEKFKRLLLNHVEVVGSNARFIAMYFEEEKELPKNDRRVKEYQSLRRQHTDTLIKLYRQGVEKGVFQDIDPRISVFTLLGACNWVYRWYRENKEYNPSQIANLIVNILGEGYLSPGPDRLTPIKQ